MAAPLRLFGDSIIRSALDRLMHEASLFAKTSCDLVTEETLRQRAIKPVKRQFRPHIGAVDAPVAPEWQTREIVSEYGYSTLSDGGIREFRKPVSMDGVPLPDRSSAVERLAASIRPGNDSTKRKLLEDFEKLGLVGTVTDFGQLLLLFDGAGQEHFEFGAGQRKLVGTERAIAVDYQQRGGPAALTLWGRGRPLRETMAGQIWFRETDLLPLKIGVVAISGDGNDKTREEAEVEYTRSDFDVITPASVIHREYRTGGLTAENRFSYNPFRKFGSESTLQFPAPDPAR